MSRSDRELIGWHFNQSTFLHELYGVDGKLLMTVTDEAWKFIPADERNRMFNLVHEDLRRKLR